MRLAVSNIAWAPEEEEAVADLLADLGVDAVEIAPTKCFADPTAVSDAELDAYVARWRTRGIDVVAFQSMLFGRPDLTLFDDAETRERTTRHMSSFLELAGRMGARVLVFGSPKNRIVPVGMSADAATGIAREVFSRWGELAMAAGTRLCIEPNPVAYGTNFVTTAREGRELVELVGSEGFGLHLDAAGMTMAGDDLAAEIVASADVLRHFHVSAPQLTEPSEDSVDHAAAAGALRGIGYDRVVSIEMRPAEPGETLDRVSRAVALARRHYLSA